MLLLYLRTTICIARIVTINIYIETILNSNINYKIM